MLPSQIVDLPPLHQSTPHSTTPLTTAKPSYKLLPGCISFAGTVTTKLSEDEKETIRTVVINLLNKDSWTRMSEEGKRDVIDTQGIIYLKSDQNGKIVEIGAHILACEKIDKELKMERFLLGEWLLPADIPVRAMPDTSYANMIRAFLPQLV